MESMGWGGAEGGGTEGIGMGKGDGHVGVGWQGSAVLAWLAGTCYSSVQGFPPAKPSSDWRFGGVESRVAAHSLCQSY
jgi:hypothetical protein